MPAFVHDDFTIEIKSVRFVIRASDDSEVEHEGPLQSLREAVVSYARNLVETSDAETCPTCNGSGKAAPS